MRLGPLHMSWGKKNATGTSLRTLLALGMGTDIDVAKVVKEGYKENPTVYAATDRITTAAMAVPWVAQEEAPTREDAHATRDLPPAHPVAKLLMRPDFMGTHWDMLTTAVLGSMVLAGRAYIYLNGPGADRADVVRPGAEPRELIVLEPHRVMPNLNQVTGEYDTYTVTSAHGRSMIVPRTRMVDIRLWNPDDHTKGQGKVQAAGRSVDMSNEARRWNAGLLRNMARPPGAATTETALNDIQYQRMRTQMAEKYSGAANAGKPLVLEGGLKWQTIGWNPTDMDWLKGVREVKREIATTLGVDPGILGDPEVKTYANAKEARIGLYEDTVSPLLRFYAHALTTKLRQWWPQLVLFLDFDQAPALKAARRERAETLGGLVDRGILTRNEARTELGYDPVEIPEADELYAPMSTAPLGGRMDDPNDPLDNPDAEEDPDEEPPEDGPDQDD